MLNSPTKDNIMPKKTNTTAIYIEKVFSPGGLSQYDFFVETNDHPFRVAVHGNPAWFAMACAALTSGKALTIEYDGNTSASHPEYHVHYIEFA